MSDSEEQPEIQGFTVPEAVVAKILAEHAHAHMRADDLAARVRGFLGGLDVEGLVTLRRIFNLGDLRKSRTAKHLDGQLVALLEHVHHVDAWTGEDPTVALREGQVPS